MPEGADGLRVAIEAKGFGAVPVLADIGFDASASEVLAVLAPSGTGKTTLLRIVLGVDRAFSGRVMRPPGGMGAVFQEPRLLPWLDVGANLRLVAPDLGGWPIGDLLGLVGLGDVAGLMPGQLSLGMARRVALARALAVRPALLVLDEPFASLDPRLAATLARDVTAQARRMDAVTLLATHDLGQAMAVADRILVLGGASPARLAADVPVTSTSCGALEARFPFLQRLVDVEADMRSKQSFFEKKDQKTFDS